MSKILSVDEALASMKGKKNEKGEIVVNRFNKRNFNLLMKALANDPDFTSQITKSKKGNLVLEEVMVGKNFRKWCKKLVEKAGIDKSESDFVMSKDFEIDDVEGLYDFFVCAVYEYMNVGNRFDLPSKNDFQGGFYLKDIDESVKIADAHNPKDHSYIGTFETTKKKHKELRSKSNCPKHLTSKKEIKK